jgi:transcriptional regulator with XRE-family HTH domain
MLLQQCVVFQTIVNIYLSAKKLKEIREKMGLSQAQMAGLIGLNRSYLAELETGRRALKKWVLAKAGEIERRIGGVNLVASKSEKPPEAADLARFQEAVAGLSSDELGELVEYFTQAIESAPKPALLLYRVASSIAITEIQRRLNLASQQSHSVLRQQWKRKSR